MTSPSARRAQKERNLGLALIAVVALVIATIISVRLMTAPESFDPETLCPKDAPARGYFVLLFDVSDPLNNIQRVALKRQLTELVAGIPEYHRVRIFVIHRGNDESALPEASFDRCRPPRGATVSKWHDNPAKREEVWQKEFEAPLLTAIENVTHAPGQKNSPIMELIQAAALESFPATASAGTTRELVVVSDFLQHTEKYSHYGTAPPRFESFARSEYAEKVHTDLSGVSVQMLYLRRDGLGQVQGRDHQEFWKRFFIWSGTESHGLRIVSIEG